MPAWAAFGALTLVVIVVLLLLSVASARAVDATSIADRTTALERSERRSRRRPGRQRGSRTASTVDPRLPRFEAPAERAGPPDPPATSPDMSTGALLANVAITQGLFGVVVLAAALYFAIPLSALGFETPAVPMEAVALGLTLGVALWLANELAASVADAVGVGYDESVRSMLTPDSTTGWVVLLVLILPTIAFVEELLFRGAAIGAMAAGFDLPPAVLVVVSSVAFGGAHGAQGKVGAAVATALGLALGVAFVLTGSLLAVVLAHYLVNALEFLVHEGLGVERPLATAAVPD